MNATEQFEQQMIEEELNAKARQVGGDHYQMPIQPIEFIQKNNIPYCEANAIKYLCRHRKKNGAEDLLKAKQYIDFILEHEYGAR